MVSTPLKNKEKNMEKTNLEKSWLFAKIIESFIEEYSEEKEEIFFYLN